MRIGVPLYFIKPKQSQRCLLGSNDIPVINVTVTALHDKASCGNATSQSRLCKGILGDLLGVADTGTSWEQAQYCDINRLACNMSVINDNNLFRWD